jgi:hypothetical protein
MERMNHMGLSVEGALNAIKNRANNSKSFAQHDDGRYMTIGELKDVLRKALKEGKKVLPTGECDNFDYQRGCRGHYTCITKDVDFETGNG